MLPGPSTGFQRAPGLQRAQISSQRALREATESPQTAPPSSQRFPRELPEASQVLPRSGNGSKNYKNDPKRVQKNDLGGSGGQEKSKLRCRSIGSIPGQRKPLRKFKNEEKRQKRRKCMISVFFLFPGVVPSPPILTVWGHPLESYKGRGNLPGLLEPIPPA